ncbi:MAG TPA: RnfABCDGE type electron transport complex subunit D [Bacillota bacterium]|nr:RnfABCDGE type electron transport complex subunit D [Bacillota bacterium]
MKENKSLISESPFIYAAADTSLIMRDVLIALLPCVALAVYVYGPGVLLTFAVSVGSCVILEAVYQKLMNKPVRAGDLSAAVTGLIIAMNLPPFASPLLVVLGAFIAIIIVKQLFGGIGRNFVNPALVAIIVLGMSFPQEMKAWVVNDKMTPVIVEAAAGATTGPTALELFKLNAALPSDLQMFIGLKNGTLGQLCSLAVIAGGIYLVARRVISPVLSSIFFLTVAALTLMWGYSPLFQIFAGGTLFFGIFMANDCVTAPVTAKGKLIAGLLYGFLSMFFRAYSLNVDGMGYALLFVNILTPRIDALTMPKPAGGKGRRIL